MGRRGSILLKHAILQYGNPLLIYAVSGGDTGDERQYAAVRVRGKVSFFRPSLVLTTYYHTWVIRQHIPLQYLVVSCSNITAAATKKKTKMR